MNTFKRDTRFFNQKAIPQTAYLKGREEWDGRIGSARVQAANWRFLSLGLVGLCLLLSFIIFWQAQQSRVVPYIVEIKDEGAITVVGPAIKKYKPTDTQISYFLASFIKNFRSLSSDPVIVRANWLKAYDFIIDDARLTLNEHAKRIKPFSRIGKQTVAVEIMSVVRASRESFQVRWKEKIFENGSLASQKNYTGVLSIKISPPNRAKILKKNPLGIYIKNLDWSQDITTSRGKK